MQRIIAIATVAVVAGLGAAAAAQSAPVARVSYADLDLSRAAARQVLNQRIEHAIKVVCGERPAPVELGKVPGWRGCRTAAEASANQQLAEAVSGPRFAEASVTIRAPGR